MRPSEPRRTTGNGEPNRSWRHPRLVAVVLSLVLVASACSGGDDGSAPDAEDVPTADTAGGDDSAPDNSADGTDSVPQAEVTIGDETYRFAEEGFAASSNCTPNRLGAFRALLRLVDESGELTARSDLDLVLVHDPSSTDRPESDSIRLRLGHLEDALDLNFTPGWYADAAHAEESTGLEPGTSQVDSYVIDGNTVSGTATFVDVESDTAFFRGEIDSVESVDGTFTVTCSGP